MVPGVGIVRICSDGISSRAHQLTVDPHRESAGEWICLDAQTVFSPCGAGLAASALLDGCGPVGIGVQSLLAASKNPAGER